MLRAQCSCDFLRDPSGFASDVANQVEQKKEHVMRSLDRAVSRKTFLVRLHCAYHQEKRSGAAATKRRQRRASFESCCIWHEACVALWT